MASIKNTIQVLPNCLLFSEQLPRPTFMSGMSSAGLGRLSTSIYCRALSSSQRALRRSAVGVSSSRSTHRRWGGGAALQTGCKPDTSSNNRVSVSKRYSTKWKFCIPPFEAKIVKQRKKTRPLIVKVFLRVHVCPGWNFSLN